MAYHFLNFWLRKIVYFNWLNSIYSSNINSIQFNPLTFKIIQFRPSVKICHIVAVSFYFCQFSILLFKGLHLFGLDLFLFQNTLCVGQFCPMFKLCGREARPNIIFIHTNRARKGPAQYPVWGQTNIRGQPAEEWTKLPSEERWGILIRNWAVSEDDGHFGTFVRGI